MVHHTNLAMQTLSQIPIMKSLKDTLKSLYFFLFHNSKRHLEFLKLVEHMKGKGKKILWNVKTLWISMLNPTKRVMAMYMPLLAKMVKERPSIMSTKVNFELICDVNYLISLSCLLPRLEIVHALIKFA